MNNQNVNIYCNHKKTVRSDQTVFHFTLQFFVFSEALSVDRTVHEHAHSDPVIIYNIQEVFKIIISYLFFKFLNNNM